MPDVYLAQARADFYGFDAYDKTLQRDAFAQSVTLPTAWSGPVAFAPRVYDPNVVPVDFAVEVWDRSSQTVIGTLDEAKGHRWQETLNEPGSASVVVQNTDPGLELVTEDTWIRFRYKGWSAFMMLPRELDRADVAQGEESAQTTTISGPGHLAVLDEAVIFPARGVGRQPVEEDRVFSWASLDYNDTWWHPSMVVVPSVGGHPSGPWEGTTKWTTEVDTTAQWMWGWGGAAGWAPGGNCYFRRQFTAEPGEVTAIINVAVDDIADVYLDGQLMFSTDPWNNTPDDIKNKTVQCTGGTHLIAIAAQNCDIPASISTFNPAGVLAAVHMVDAFGNKRLAVKSDNSWNMLAYPPRTPGMTIGEILRIVVTEANYRGALVDVTLGFTDQADTDGTPWDILQDVSTKCGTDVLTFVRELTGSYCDVDMEHGQPVLRAWVQDGKGATVPTTFAASTAGPWDGNVTALTRRFVL